ncbi:MAG: type III PLP-dependent enzyme, partial [Marmoricola sp.]|nr:type III PLP-dependent enzyme [Marmoricola sp.]
AGESRPTSTPALSTPFLRLDVTKAVGRFRRLAAAFPETAVHYAVKANPHPALLRALVAAHARFDVASPAEVRAVLRAGASPEHVVHSNPVARRDHLAESWALGVRLFTADSPGEVRKLAEVAPGSAVLCRLVTSGEGSDWPLSRKYGCATSEAVELLTLAADLGLEPAGISFHVGSQQRDPDAWGPPIHAAARVFADLWRRGLGLRLLDLGGGFPAFLDDRDGGPSRPPAITTYAEVIGRHLHEAFDGAPPRTIVEPGRGIVGDAGTVVASVVEVVQRGPVRWVYLDAGVFTGLVETLGEAIRYRLGTDAPGPLGPCVLAGPTCDSVDVLYEDHPVLLPLSLVEGDQVRLHAAGAYTTCYSTVGFNGFDPLPTVVQVR